MIASNARRRQFRAPPADRRTGTAATAEKGNLTTLMAPRGAPVLKTTFRFRRSARRRRISATVSAALVAGLAAPVALSATTPAAAATCPCSVWSATAAPTTPSANDGSAVEVGLKFRSDVNGYVTGVRFYKGAGNTGTHIG